MGSVVKGVERIFGVDSSGPDTSGMAAIQQMGLQNLQAVQPQQQAFAKQLADQALGKAPSIAEAQLQSAMNRNLQQQLAAAKSQRSVNPALAARQTAVQAGQAQQQTASAAAIARMQEQQQQQQMFSNFLNSQSNTALGAANAQAGVQQQQQQMYNQLFGNLVSGAAAGFGAGATGGATATSDKTAKKDVKPADEKMQKFLDALKSYEYKYKDEKHGKGKQLGVMAQDLEKTPAGKAMVSEDQEGTKVVDYGKGFGQVLAAMAQMNERLKEIEAKKTKKG